MSTPPGLLLVNQSVGPLFMGVVSAAARRAPVDLLLGGSSVPAPAEVCTLAGLPYRRQPAWRRLLTWGGFSLQLTGRLLAERLAGLLGRGRYGRLLVVSNPPLAPLLAPLAGRPYALLLYDLYPDVLEQLDPHLQASPPHGPVPGRRAAGSTAKHLLLKLLSCLWRLANRQVYARAERVITLSPGMAAALKPCFSDPLSWERTVRVVPPWADTSLIRPVPPAENLFRRQQGLEGNFVVLYSGNLGLTHPLEPLLEAGVALAGRRSHPAESEPPIALVLIGNGPKRAALERQAARHPGAPVRFLEPLPIEQVSHSYSAADLAVVCLDGPAAQASLPSKAFTALATGTPILALAPPSSELAALVERHRCGLVVPPGPGAAATIASLLPQLAADPERCAAMARQALAASRAYGPANAERLIDLWLGTARPSTAVP